MRERKLPDADAGGKIPEVSSFQIRLLYKVIKSTHPLNEFSLHILPCCWGFTRPYFILWSVLHAQATCFHKWQMQERLVLIDMDFPCSGFQEIFFRL